MISEDRTRWTVRDVAAQQLAACGVRVFLEEVGGEGETYRTFIGRSAAIARFLARVGVGHGDAVATLCQNGCRASTPGSASG